MIEDSEAIDDMNDLIIEVIGFLLSLAFLCIVIMILMDDIPNLFF